MVKQGGNIISALNVPSETFHDSVNGLVDRLETSEYCLLSDVNGKLDGLCT
jgi:hypothetical protein